MIANNGEGCVYLSKSEGLKLSPSKGARASYSYHISRLVGASASRSTHVPSSSSHPRISSTQTSSRAFHDIGRERARGTGILTPTVDIGTHTCIRIHKTYMIM